MLTAALILAGYLAGSLPFGYWVVRAFKHVDIRTVGSGNAGGTNALRTQGKVFALWVMIIDIGKGILSAAVIPLLVIPGVGIDASVDRSLVLYGVAFAAIVGHVFPVWFGFRGGKGAATAAGLVCYLAPAAGLAMLGSWVLIAFTTGFVGLATIGAALVAVLVMGFTALPEESGLFLFGCATAALVIYAHRGNIRRMLDGTESRFSTPAARWLRRGE